MPIAVVCPIAVSKCQAFVVDVNDAFQKVESTKSTILRGDFNAHIETDSETQKGVIGSHGGLALTRKTGIYSSSFFFSSPAFPQWFRGQQFQIKPPHLSILQRRSYFTCMKSQTVLNKTFNIIKPFRLWSFNWYLSTHFNI